MSACPRHLSSAALEANQENCVITVRKVSRVDTYDLVQIVQGGLRQKGTSSSCKFSSGLCSDLEWADGEKSEGVDGKVASSAWCRSLS